MDMISLYEKEHSFSCSLTCETSQRVDIKLQSLNMNKNFNTVSVLLISEVAEVR